MALTSLLRDQEALTPNWERVWLKPTGGPLRNVHMAPPEAYPALNTPSPTSFSSKAQGTLPWTGFSLTFAVSWMLLLAFSKPSTEASPEQVTAKTDLATEIELLNGLYASTLGLPLARWPWQAALLGRAATTTK